MIWFSPRRMTAAALVTMGGGVFLLTLLLMSPTGNALISGVLFSMPFFGLSILVRCQQMRSPSSPKAGAFSINGGTS